MDLETKQRWVSVLEAERNRLIENGKIALKQDLTIPTEDLSDEADYAANLIQQNLSFELRQRERTLIAKINTALKRLQDGSFGQCRGCEEDIETKRLEAHPLTYFCLVCQEQDEHRSKVFA